MQWRLRDFPRDDDKPKKDDVVIRESDGQRGRVTVAGNGEVFVVWTGCGSARPKNGLLSGNYDLGHFVADRDTRTSLREELDAKIMGVDPTLRQEIAATYGVLSDIKGALEAPNLSHPTKSIGGWTAEYFNVDDGG